MIDHNKKKQVKIDPKNSLYHKEISEDSYIFDMKKKLLQKYIYQINI